MMKTLAAVAASAALAFAVVSPAAAAPVSPDDVAEILQSKGYNVSGPQQGMLLVDADGIYVLVGVQGSDGDVTYLTYLSGVSLNELGYEFLNEFNNEVKFGRAYVDDDGDIAIQMDRNSAGGVSAQNIASDFDVFLMLISKFMSDLSSSAAV